MPPKVPDQIKVGSLRYRVWQLTDGRLAADYTDEKGKRRVIKKRSIDALRAALDGKSELILNAETAAMDTTADDRRMFVAAREALAATGRPVDAAAREYAEAWQLTGGIPLLELARFYKQQKPAAVECPPTPAVVTALIHKLQDDRCDPKYVAGIRRDLDRFAAKVPNLSLALEEDVRTYLRGLTDRTGLPPSDRRRDNIRDAIVTLFRFARDREFLSRDRQTVAERIKRLDPGVEVATYSPAEMTHLLEHVSDRWKPWMVIAAFAGLRTSEIFRLDWSSVKFDQHVISVTRRVARKVRVDRLVPMTDNLVAWLRPWADVSGPIYPNRQSHGPGPAGKYPAWKTLEHHHGLEIARLKEKAGIAWESNALRHSYGSHRLAIVKNFATVALEMGNSPAMVRKHYNDPKPEAVGKTYFALSPDTANNVIALPLQF